MSSPWNIISSLLLGLLTFVHLLKQLSTRVLVVCLRDEPALVQNVHISPKNKNKQLCEDAGWSWWACVIIYSESSSVSTWANRPLSQENTLFQKKHRKARLQFADAHKNKDLIFADVSCDLMKLKLNFLTILTIITFGLLRENFTSLRTPFQIRNMGVTASCCGVVLLQERLVPFQK